jgi:transposase
MLSDNFTLSAITALSLALCAGNGFAQSSCDSDQAPRPVSLLERFINAECQDCWSDVHTPKPNFNEVALDWIVPASRGQDAPLSAAATRDSTARLQALARPVPAEADSTRRPATAPLREIRVAHGLAFNGYVGASIEMKPGTEGPWRAWLVLVETVPAGTEGSPVERNLVRNTLQPAWDPTRPLSKEEQARLYESRPMSIPEGADPRRLRVIGWVEDSAGQIRGIAESRCATP